MKFLSKTLLVLTMFLLAGASAHALPEIYAIGNDVPICNLNDGPCMVTCNPIDEFCLDQINTRNGMVVPFASNLHKIDPTTGEPTEIGPTGYGPCDGLEIHPDTGELYAVCSPLIMPGYWIPPYEMMSEADNRGILLPIFPGGQVLVKLDKETGEGTEIGPLGTALGRGAFVSDIAFRADGVLFAYVVSSTDSVWSVGESTNTVGPIVDNSLGIINLSTGYLSIVGETHVWDQYSAIGFTPSQKLAQCANFLGPFIGPIQPGDVPSTPVDIFEINQKSGESFFISPLDFPPDFDVNHINQISSKDMYYESGMFYGLLNTIDYNNMMIVFAERAHGPEGSFLVTIDEFGTLDIIGQISQLDEEFTAIAVNSKFIANVPTMSEYGLIFTAIMILGASVLFLRRKRAVSQT